MIFIVASPRLSMVAEEWLHFIGGRIDALTVINIFMVDAKTFWHHRKLFWESYQRIALKYWRKFITNNHDERHMSSYYVFVQILFNMILCATPPSKIYFSLSQPQIAYWICGRKSSLRGHKLNLWLQKQPPRPPSLQRREAPITGGVMDILKSITARRTREKRGKIKGKMGNVFRVTHHHQVVP